MKWGAGAGGGPGAAPCYETDPAGGREALWQCELEVALMVCEGLTDNAIAERLDIEASTVRTDLKRIFERLGAQRRSGVARLAGALLLNATRTHIVRPGALVRHHSASALRRRRPSERRFQRNRSLLRFHGPGKGL
jgi:DNA-binding CsgD family transcriptional regulator